LVRQGAIAIAFEGEDWKKVIGLSGDYLHLFSDSLPIVYQWQGIAYAETGKKAKAMSALRKAAAHPKTAPDSLFWLSKLGVQKPQNTLLTKYVEVCTKELESSFWDLGKCQ